MVTIKPKLRIDVPLLGAQLFALLHIRDQYAKDGNIKYADDLEGLICLIEEIYDRAVEASNDDKE